MPEPIVCLMGPTAVGKTDLAVWLVEHLPLEIVSVDSAMVYRQMDIGTAKPDAATRARAPHHLIDFLDPTETYSAARFVEDARRAMRDIRARGHIPLLVGGTGLYFRALEQGLAPLPDGDPGVRARLAAELEAQGSAALHARLAEADPAAAARIHPNDPQRIQRALEVFELTGRPLSWFHAQAAPAAPGACTKIALLPPDRAELHGRIERRFDAMLEQGFVEEVAALYGRGDLTGTHTSMRAVGYRQVWRYLAGEYDRDEMRQRGIYATRQYAKRQITWLRGEADAVAFDAQSTRLKSDVHGRLAGNLAGMV